MKKWVTLTLIAGRLAFLVSSFGKPTGKALPAGVSSTGAMLSRP